MKTWALLFLASACLQGATISATATVAPGGVFQQINHPGTVSSFAPISVIVSSTSTVAYGYLHAEAEANCGFVAFCSASAEAAFVDSITIYGTSGILQANVVDGASGGRTDFSFGTIFGNGGATGTTCDLQFPALCQQAFLPGAPIIISGQIILDAIDSDPQDTSFGAMFSLGMMSFSNFSVVDQQGNPITGFQYTSDSLTD